MSGTVASKESPEVSVPRGSAERVMLEVLIHGPLSRVELAERLGLSGPSLTRITKALLADGRLFEGAPTTRANGRPPQPLDLDASSERFAGVKLTRDTVHTVITDLRGTVLARRDEPLPDRSPDAVADAVTRNVRGLAAAGPLRGVGIGLGGNSADGRLVRESHFLEWTDVPLAALVEERLGLPVVVANDVTALTQAQHWFGAGRGLDSLVVVTIGAGIGMGLVTAGDLVVGANGALGSIGHQPLLRSDAVCWRGHHGCASALLTTEAIEQAALRASGRAVPYDEVLRAAADGDAALHRVVDDAAAALGTLLAGVANLIDPQKIVLAGEGARIGDVGREAMLAAFADAVAWRTVATPIDVQPFAFDEWARGAATMAIRARMLR